MGAGCSGNKAAQVANTINKIELSKEAKEHLKQLGMNNQDLINKQNQKQKQKKIGSEEGGFEDSVEDLDQQLPNLSQQKKNQKLWDAIENNEIQKVEKILCNQAESLQQFNESDLYDQTGQSMIHKAASMGHVEILMLLLERTGAKPDLSNAQLATPLHLACKNNRENVAKFLIGCGVDVNVQDEHGQTPLLIACIHGHQDLASLIVESSIAGHTPEPLEIDLRDHRGLTPLNCSAIKGDLKLTKLLIERGGANIEEASPKGCTPLLYAARGGYQDVVRYLLEKGASPLKQDNAGGTVLHHTIEKCHLDVLQVLVEYGVDVYSAIEIADNAGRTPIFEAIDNNVSAEVLKFLTRKRSKGGFGASVNVVNYNGHTPLYGAVREANFDNIKVLVEEAGARVDLTGSENKEEEEEDDYQSLEEKYFMEAYRNAMTPLQLAVVLGHDHILHYLIEHGANPNKQTSVKGYSCLHLAVLANKPEIIIELLTKTSANPNLPDYSGRTLSEMIEIFIPDYLETFNQLIENLQMERLKRVENEQSVVATHYYNPDDERQLKGVQDLEQPNQIYLKENENKENDIEYNADQQDDQQKNPQKRFLEMDDSEIEVEEGRAYERDVEVVFGRKIALGLIAINWKFKELAMKIVFKQSEKFLTQDRDQSISLKDYVKACTIAVDMTCKEKVIKVFNLSLQLLNLLITSPKVEQYGIIDTFKNVVIERNIVAKLLQKGEEGNTRLTNKIHETLLDLSFHPKIGEAHASSFILQRIHAHNKATKAEVQGQEQTGVGSFKGLLAQLALLYKFVNSFGVSPKKRGPLNVVDILNAILPSLSHQSQDVRNATTKIILDVHRLTGCVKDEYLSSLNDKTKQAILEKLAQVQVEKNVNDNKKDEEDSLYELSQDNIEQSTDLNEAKEKIIERAQSKDWTERELALKQMKEAFESGSKKQLLEETFLTNCTVLLKSCFEDNNITLYLESLEVAVLFFQKAIFSEVVMLSLQSLVKPIVLRTTDTNTRVRKKSVDIINMIWNQQSHHTQNKSGSQEDTKKDTISSQIAEILCDSQLQEKAIIGRLGLFIKKASQIENPDELNKRPHQIILGKNYEQLIEFSCHWCAHKNIKVRQNALKLIIEVCRLNSIDPRGQPFKQRIINYILGLRPSLRDPLVKKINEVCGVFGGAHEGEEKQMYIDVNELELNIATKNRSVSMDVNKRQNNSALPDIGGKSLPSVMNTKTSSAQPTIVLPHSEPLSEEQKQRAQALIELFNLEIMTCFYSQTWSTRQAAIEKVSEQLYNIDPDRRDAMSSEINRKNLPIEDNFKTFLEFIEEGTKDPNLKNFISILELLQKSLPIFFRYIQPNSIKRSLLPLVSMVLKKTADLKQKVREASINFCLYLSHQSPIGPETMVNQVLQEIQTICSQQSNNVAANLGNAHMLASCLKLLQQFQQQTKILEKQKTNQDMFSKFMTTINASLKHQNPQVRKEAEQLFKVLYHEFGEKLDSQLQGQKPQVVQKLLQEAKAETGVVIEQKQAEYNLQRAQTQIRTELINQSALSKILKGQEEQLNNLKLPNPKKRLKSIVEIKKALQKQMVNLNGQSARELFEPLTMLLRQLLQDDNADIYLESLNLLKFIVGQLAPHLSTLDLHLMMGSFIGIIVNNTVSGNMRIQMASDKVIIFFAKHNNIGPFVVAKDVLKNIEKIIKAVQVITKKDEQQVVLQDKKTILLRFISILQLLLQHFSIVLCYQTEFYDKCLEAIADTMILVFDDQAIKNLCVQLIVNLSQIDSKLLENAISKLDVSRKTPLKKTIIEMEHQQRQGKNVMTQDHHAFVAGINPGSKMDSSAAPLGEIRNSMMSSSRTSLFSPGSTFHNSSPGGFDSSQYEWSKKSIDVINKQAQQATNTSNYPERRGVRRMISVDNNDTRNYTPTLVATSMQGKQMKEDEKDDGGIILPQITPMQSTNYQQFSSINQNPLHSQTITANTKMSLTSTGGAGFNSNVAFNQRTMRTISTNENPTSGLVGNRPPLYIPTKRESSITRQSTQTNPNQVLAQQQPQLKQSLEQFKTEFNSQKPSIMTGLGQPSTYIPSIQQSTTSSLQKKQTGGSSMFKQSQPSGFTFESNVKRYQESTNKGPMDEI